MTINQAKEMDMVDYLSSLGHEPKRISGKSYWYLSPLHEEKTASFKVNRQLNRWYDFGEGKGGNLVDFGVLYYRCNVVCFLQKLNGPGISSERDSCLNRIDGSKEEEPNRIKILSLHPLSSYPLIQYLRVRRIPGGIADKYCSEVRYQLADRIYYAIGFKNDRGGYELRNPNFKGSTSPKDSSFIDNKERDLAVFEGFFNFLSYLSIQEKQEMPSRNFLILNSASFFEKCLPKMLEHQHVHLFLDNDNTGQKYTLRAVTQDREKFKDERHLYQKYNDLNDWIMHVGLSQKQNVKQKP